MHMGFKKIDRLNLKGSLDFGFHVNGLFLKNQIQNTTHLQQGAIEWTKRKDVFS